MTSNDNCSKSTSIQCSGGGDTSPKRHSGRISANLEHSSQMSSFGGPSPAQQPPMGLFMEPSLLCLHGASASGTRKGIAQPMPMASSYSECVCHVTEE